MNSRVTISRPPARVTHFRAHVTRHVTLFARGVTLGVTPPRETSRMSEEIG
jgi:hypothetical protein